MTCGTFEDHDHRTCRDSALAAAERLAARDGLRLTAARRCVFEALLASPKALGAYEILGRLGQVQPPTVYRALEFLVAHGLAHRVESRNAYVACAAPGSAHDAALLICRTCDAVAETRLSEGSRALGHAAADLGFRIETTVVEAQGLCPACARA